MNINEENRHLCPYAVSVIRFLPGIVCQSEKHKRELKEQIEDGEIEETSYEDEIYCPWCGEEIYYEPADDYDILYSEGDHRDICPACGKPFSISTSVSYSYSTTRRNVDE